MLFPSPEKRICMLRGCSEAPACLPLGSPDAKCWLECFFPAPKNSFVCFAVAQRPPSCLLVQMLNVGFRAFRICMLRGGPRVVFLPSGAPDAKFWLECFSQPEKSMCVLRGRSEAPELFACPQAFQIVRQPRKNTFVCFAVAQRPPRVLALSQILV